MTGAEMGFSGTQYALLVQRMLKIGIRRLRRQMKVVNGVFGVRKVRPEKAKRKQCGPGSDANTAHGRRADTERHGIGPRHDRGPRHIRGQFVVGATVGTRYEGE